MNDNILILSDDNKEVVGVKDKSIKSLVIPDGVKKLGFKCFKGCKHLNLISIPKSVVVSYFCQVFSDCPNLKTIIFNCTSIPHIGHSTVKEVIISENVMAIDNGAFHECYNLTSIKVDKENAKYDSRDDCNAVIKTETDELIAACVNSSIPQSVRIIGEYAFYSLSGHSFTDKKNVVLPKSVVEIKEKAFCGSDIVSIIIPESVKEIGANAFSNCCSLTKVCINDGVKEIKKDTFSGCSSLTSITIPNSVTSIGKDAFHGCCNLKSLIIPEGATIIGDYAFDNCDGLLSINIPKTVMSIGYNAFEGCVNLSNVEFASIYSLCRIKFKSIQSNPLIFSHQLSINGKTIKKVIIPNDVTEIGAYTFAGCYDITNFYIPNSVTTINTQAFIDCRSITIVELSSNVKTIATDAFDGCKSLNYFDVDKHNHYFTSIDGILYDKSATTLLRYPPSHEGIEFYIPEGVSVIGHRAFYGCTGLSSIIIPNNVTNLGCSAFEDCVSLSAVVLSKGISFIEDSLFKDCKSLKYLEIPNGVTRIGDSAFYGCI